MNVAIVWLVSKKNNILPESVNVVRDIAQEAPTNKDSGRRSGVGTPFVAFFSILTVDRAPLSRRSTIPTPKIDTSNIWGRSTNFQYISLSWILFSVA